MPTATRGTAKKEATKATVKPTTKATTKGKPFSTGSTIPSGSNRRPDIEQTLAELGITDVSYIEGVSPADFDVERSLRNQARFKQLDHDVVTRYAEAWERGDKFPPLVAYRKGNKLVTADGNHRLVALDSIDVDRTLDIYEVKAPAKTLAVLTMVANTKHGLPVNIDERVAHAIFLMDNGVSMPQAAQRMQVPVKEIQKRWNKVAADRRASEVGILMSDWEKLTQGVRQRLTNIKTDEGFEAAARLCLRAQLTIEEVHDLVTQVNETRSGARQAKIVADLEHAYTERIEELAGGTLGGRNGRMAQSTKGRFHMILSQITALPENASALASSYSEEERAEAASRARSSAARLAAFADALES